MTMRFLNLGLMQVVVAALGTGVILSDTVIFGPSLFGIGVGGASILMLLQGWRNVLNAVAYSRECELEGGE